MSTRDILQEAREVKQIIGSKNLESYISAKIPSVILLDKKIAALEQELRDTLKLRAENMKKELEDLREQTGIDIIMAKSTGLTKEVNKLESTEEQ